MSTIERLQELMDSGKLNAGEVQAILDAIRLIQGFQADRVAAYEAKNGGGVMKAEKDPTLPVNPNTIAEPARMMVCMEAIWEIDALVRTLPSLSQQNEGPEGARDHFLLRAAAGRILRLTSVLMSGLDDVVVDTATLESMVHLDGGQG